MSIVRLNRNDEITHTLISSLTSCGVIVLNFLGATILWRTHNPDVVFEKPWKPSTEHQVRSEEEEKLWWRSHFHVQDLFLEKLEALGKRTILFASFRADSVPGTCHWLIDCGGYRDNYCPGFFSTRGTGSTARGFAIFGIFHLCSLLGE